MLKATLWVALLLLFHQIRRLSIDERKKPNEMNIRDHGYEEKKTQIQLFEYFFFSF